MKIPSKIKISGQEYSVSQVRGMADSGNSDTSNNIILIKEDMAQTEKESCLLHEIIEVINANNDFNLNHQTIQTFENCLYQVLKDNKLEF